MNESPSPSIDVSGVHRSMAAGMAWMSLLRIGIKLLGLISTVVLARLLTPADFGLVAMATSVIAGLELFRAFNFDVPLIQMKNPGRSAYDTAWTLDILLGFVLGLALLLIAFPAARFYGEPRLTHVMQALALGTLISGFENIGVVAFRKELTFRREFSLRIAQKVCSLMITLPLAFALRSYWALVIGMVGGNLLGVAVSYAVHEYRPRFSLAAMHDLLSFSKWLLLNNVLWFLRDRLPDYVLGRLAGAGALGLFSISYEISNLPTTDLIAPINRAVFPGYAKLAHDLDKLREGFLNVIALVATLALPAGLGIAATSKLIVNVALGAKWAAAAPAISILAIHGAISALQTNCGAVHYSMGRPRMMTFIGVCQVLVLAPAVIWSAHVAGAMGVAWSYLITTCFIVPLNYMLVIGRIRLRVASLLGSLWRPAVASTLMYWLTRGWVAGAPADSIRSLGGAVVIGCGSYSLILMGLWLLAGQPPGPERSVRDKFLLPMWQRVVR